MAIVSQTIKLLGATEKEVVKEQFYYGLVEKNVLVTGADGQLGSELKAFVNNINSPFRLFFTNVENLDITNRGEIEGFVVNNNIQYIINCAAYTDVDKAESDRALAYEVNVTGVENIAEVAKQNGAKVIHISTDFVFDGSMKLPYKENITTNPLSVYGLTKLQGEDVLKSKGKDWLIIRTSWLYSEYGPNFVNAMLRLMQERESLSVVEDEVGSPTYAADLAVMIIHILQFYEQYEWTSNVYHFCNRGEVSRFEFAKEIQRLAGMKNCKITPITAREYGATAARPSYSALDTSKIASVFGVEIPHWEDSLKRFLQKINKKNKFQ